MARFDLQRFLAETGVSVTRLASYLRVAPTYLEAAAVGEGKLTARDQAACRLLRRRLIQAVQLDLPFAEPRETFTRQHARRVARERALAAPARPRRGRQAAESQKAWL